jgi:hypothetical protein
MAWLQVEIEMKLHHVICRWRIVKVVEGVHRILGTLRRDALGEASSVALVSAYLDQVRRCRY